MIASFPDRRFQLWEYKVSHGSLLVRSPRGPEVEHNIDLMFAGVEYLSSPRHLRGLELDHGDQSDVDTAVAALGREAVPERVFVLTSEGRRHLVVAAGYRIREHRGDIFDSPFV